MAGQPMIAKVVARVIAAGLGPVFVVTGHDFEPVTKAIGGLDVQCIHNSDYQEGMASSIGQGIAALDESVEGAMICLGDMPWVQTSTLVRIAEAFYPEGGQEICRPIYNGRLGNPVLFARRHFEALMSLKGDSGGKLVIQQSRSVVFNINVDDAGVLRDLDWLPT